MPIERLHIAEEWDQYARRVMPADAAENQRQELRRAFYAGAMSCTSLMTAAFISIPSAKEFLRFMHGISKELKSFLGLVKEGRA